MNDTANYARKSVSVQRRSMLTNTMHFMDIPLHPREFFECEAKWIAGMLIQNAFPTLDADQREFIKTGITAEEWDNLSD